jgi:hypothetical protein
VNNRDLLEREVITSLKLRELLDAARERIEKAETMTNEPISDERLAEIEREHDGCEGYLDTMELIAEVRRLRERERLLEACLETERATGDEWRQHASRDQNRAKKAEAEVERLRERASESEGTA